MSAQSAKAFSTLVQTVQPSVFWEIGDTVGAYAWLLLEHSKTCKAMLFEADPDHYAAILKTISRQQLHRAEAHNIVVTSASSGVDACIASTAEPIEPRPAGVSVEQAIPPITVKRGFYGIKRSAVATLTLDRLLAKGYASPDIIKINTPDAEQVVMDGARTVLETCSPVLIVKAVSPNLVRYLKSISYRSFPFDHDNTIFISVYF